MPKVLNAHRRVRVVVLGTIAVAALFASPGHANLSDVHVKLAVATNVLTTGIPAIDPHEFDRQYPVLGRHGRYFVSYPLVDCLMYVPVALLAKVGVQCQALPPIAMLIVLAWLLLRLAEEHRISIQTSVFATCLVCMGTPLFAMACYGYDSLISDVGLAATLLICSFQPLRLRSIQLGLVLGLCFSIRDDAALLAVPAVAAIWVATPIKRVAMKQLLVTASAGLPFVLLRQGYKAWCFGLSRSVALPGPGMFVAPFSRQHLIGIAGLLISPGKGALWYGLPLLLALILIRPLIRQWPTVSVPLLFYGIAELLFHGRFEFWHGDWCWGPRYAAGLYALVLPLGWYLSRMVDRRRQFRRRCVAAFLFFIFLQAPSIFTDPVNSTMGAYGSILTRRGLTRSATYPPLPGTQRELYFRVENSPLFLIWQVAERRLRWLLEDWEVERDLFRALLPLAAAGGLMRFAFAFEREPSEEPLVAGT